jgi:hypothetical protein
VVDVVAPVGAAEARRRRAEPSSRVRRKCLRAPVVGDSVVFERGAPGLQLCRRELGARDETDVDDAAPPPPRIGGVRRFRGVLVASRVDSRRGPREKAASRRADRYLPLAASRLGQGPGRGDALLVELAPIALFDPSGRPEYRPERQMAPWRSSQGCGRVCEYNLALNATKGRTASLVEVRPVASRTLRADKVRLEVKAVARHDEVRHRAPAQRRVQRLEDARGPRVGAEPPHRREVGDEALI